MREKVQLSLEDIQPNLRVINLYQCSPGFDSGFRRLYNYYFLYVHKGKGNFIIGNKSYPAVTGDLFFCSPGTPNSIIADEADPFLLTGIEFEFTQNHRDKKLLYPIQEKLFEPDNITELVEFNDFEGFGDKISLPEDGEIRTKLYDMIHEFTSQKSHWNLYANGVMQAFIALVVQRTAQQVVGIKNNNKGDEIIRFLTENYMHDLSNSAVASKFHYHPDYINKIVYAYTGITLKQYIIDLRMRAALNLLMHSDTGIESIAYSVGYENLQYFYRLFKKKIGLSPGYFRQKILDSGGKE